MTDHVSVDRVLFVSDIHLTPALPDVFLRFCRFLREEAVGARALYVLGDLFDFWVGRKQISIPGFAEVFTRIRALAEGGTDVYFLGGNRDFLLDPDFAGAHRMRCLPDRAEVRLGGGRVLVTHGDLLVTKDRAYQRMRRVVRSTPFKSLVRALPLALSLRLAGGFRTVSGAEIGRKPAAALEPDFGLARAWLREGYDALVFGHVHRAERYHLWVNGRRADIFILGAWEDVPSYVEWDGEGLSLRWYDPGEG